MHGRKEALWQKQKINTNCSRKTFTQIERQLISKHKRMEAQNVESAIGSVAVECTRLYSYDLCSVICSQLLFRFVTLQRLVCSHYLKQDATQRLELDLCIGLPLQLAPILADKHSQTSRLGHFGTAVEQRQITRSFLL